jgi:hypothetical protein
MVTNSRSASFFGTVFNKQSRTWNANDSASAAQESGGIPSKLHVAESVVDFAETVTL